MELKTVNEVNIRFSEVDSLGIVWHGHFIKFFEDGREYFGKKYKLSYMDIYRSGFKAPVVNVNCDYKNTIKYEEVVLVETIFKNIETAKIVYDFIIWDENKSIIKAEGQSTQIFLDKNNELVLTIPDFFYDWKKSYGLI